MNTHQALQGVQRLNTTQYQSAKETALATVIKSIGQKPTRAQYQREYGRIWEILDYLLIVVFAAAFVVSSIHVADFSRVQAATAFDHAAWGTESSGIGFTEWVYTAAHQVGFILLAEFSMLVFFTRWGLARKRFKSWHGGFEGGVSLALGALAFAYVAYVNVTSGLFLFMAIIPPAVTLGVGFRLEHIAAELLHRKHQVDRKYSDHLAAWEAATEDPTQHIEYPRILRQSIFDRLIALKANAWLVDASSDIQVYAVGRELHRENVFSDANMIQVPPVTQVISEPEVITQTVFAVACDCGWANEYKSAKSAEMGLRGHKARCELKPVQNGNHN